MPGDVNAGLPKSRGRKPKRRKSGYYFTKNYTYIEMSYFSESDMRIYRNKRNNVILQFKIKEI